MFCRGLAFSDAVACNGAASYHFIQMRYPGIPWDLRQAKPELRRLGGNEISIEELLLFSLLLTCPLSLVYSAPGYYSSLYALPSSDRHDADSTSDRWMPIQ